MYEGNKLMPYAKIRKKNWEVLIEGSDLSASAAKVLLENFNSLGELIACDQAALHNLKNCNGKTVFEIKAFMEHIKEGFVADPATSPGSQNSQETTELQNSFPLSENKWTLPQDFMADQEKYMQSFDVMIGLMLQQFSLVTKQDIGRLAQKIENLEKKLSPIANDDKDASRNPLPSGKGSASDRVMDVIAGIATGADCAAIKKNTQFNDKKIRNIIYRLNKQGKIKRKKRGVYIPLSNGPI